MEENVDFPLIDVSLVYLLIHTLTWLYWVFYAEHGWPVFTPYGFEHFLL